MDIGIISYLPDKPELRAKRKSYLEKQMSWLRSVFGMGKTIHIAAQNWHAEDYSLLPGEIEYLPSEPIGPGAARNLLLRHFYSGSSRWIMLMDDDFTFYDYYGANGLLKELEDNPEKFSMCDMIIGNNPLYLPFKKKNWVDRDRVSSHWKFIRSYVNSGMPVAVLKNPVVWWNKPYFFKDNKGIPFHEDVDFTIRWIMDGHTRYQCEQWQYRDLGHLDSTLFTRERKEEHQWLINTLKSYPESWGIFTKYNKGGNLDYSYINNHNKTAKVGYVKRAVPYVFTEKEKPRGL